MICGLRGFVFDEYTFINQVIRPISTIQHDLFVADRNRIFRVDIDPAKAEFIHQALPINGLQQSGPKRCMDCHR
jgi:hypothetical protein